MAGSGVRYTADKDEAEAKIKELKDYVDDAIEQQTQIRTALENAQADNSLEWLNEVKAIYDREGRQAFEASEGALKGLQQNIDIAAEAAGLSSAQSAS